MSRREECCLPPCVSCYELVRSRESPSLHPPQSADEPQCQEDWIVLTETGPGPRHTVHQHRHDQSGPPPVDIAQGAPEEATNQHPGEQDGVDVTLPGVGQVQVALGRGKQEGDAEDLDCIRCIGPATDYCQQNVKFSIAALRQS